MNDHGEFRFPRACARGRSSWAAAGDVAEARAGSEAQQQVDMVSEYRALQDADAGFFAGTPHRALHVLNPRLIQATNPAPRVPRDVGVKQVRTVLGRRTLDRPRAQARGSQEASSP